MPPCPPAQDEEDLRYEPPRRWRLRADHHAPTQAFFARLHTSVSRRSGRRTCARDCEQGILEVRRCSMMHLSAPVLRRLELLTYTVSRAPLRVFLRLAGSSRPSKTR